MGHSGSHISQLMQRFVINKALKPSCAGAGHNLTG
uniref:Uncharacterized protein n=1 Tax=Erwinia amylovora ATCC BAA-2158 TaxID=889211 RepID=E5B7P1_ERWAM|nr:hypothetical protein predicted by Glimmer/Critica [Erwinia amylovora ATCC BAA-2158]